MDIVENIRELAVKHDLKINEKVINRIAKAKERFFGEDNWVKCPCYPPEDIIHGCGSPACFETINKDGVCHCNLYMKKDI